MSAALFVVLAIMAARVETPTVDEFAHLPAGCAYWTQGRFDLYAKNPPLVKMVMALPVVAAGAVVPTLHRPMDAWTPWLYGNDFLVANEARYLSLFWLARIVPVLFVVLTGWLLYVWVRQLFGVPAASITAALFFVNPNVLAHGHLATVDAGSMFAIFLASYALHWAYRRPTGIRLALTGAAFGVALLAKFSAVLLLPVIVVIVVVQRSRIWRRVALDGLCLFAAAWLVLNLGMGFRGSFTRLGDFKPVSSFGATLQSALPASLPIPLPAEWVSGFDQQKLDAEQGEFGNYLFGEWSERGWWYYNLVAFVVKNPLPLLALMLASLWFWRRAPHRRGAVLEIALPLIVFLGGMMAFNRLNIGVRYLLPLFPFVFLLTAATWAHRSRWRAWLAGAVLFAHVVIAILVFPDYLSYFNLAAGGPAGGYKVLLDSNLDWGQDLYRLPSALRELGVTGKIGLLYFGHVHPRLYGIDYQLAPSSPAEGVFAISLQYLMGGSYVATTPDWAFSVVEPSHAAWLRDYEPVAKAGSIWIFDTRGKLNGPGRPHNAR
jgi:4-amino-4-deoxy-L-arabinose transferase-like glycosyltransferase